MKKKKITFPKTAPIRTKIRVEESECWSCLGNNSGAGTHICYIKFDHRYSPRHLIHLAERTKPAAVLENMYQLRPTAITGCSRTWKSCRFSAKTSYH
ncbi:hypothetical protein E2C01_081694 [Portunus trituberculatus]|uniref:Uncharacterized protein n=1 Tax=Portunus trituberculatus TaxID=210409 RepID=A0A5B7IZJ3_PORTR|nr:hypothetical protein [Portunus trituberculatus]